ncbi:ABC transporter ATP-binding protein [Nesterenkonia populi]|uniref:ABC transporter ATP-binding protein n=1 Tax=Nesterenkonia populi TaxID=1591087 RepID=UPI0011BDEA80|nr:ABC transporter ATP-binding protein [Nesterenkonia populi]
METTTTSPTAIRADALTKTYGSGEARVRPLRQLSVEIPAGRYTAIMGPSGSGKSTLLHVLAGLDTVEAGSVVLTAEEKNIELTGLSERDLTVVRRQHIGVIFQAYNLVPAMTARENILLPSSLGAPQPDQHYYKTVIERLGLSGRLDHRPFELSGGQQQRIAVARALVSRPAVIFADEPTGNLDTRTGAEVLGLLRAAVDEFGQTVVMVTHDASAAAEADRTVILNDGQIIDTLEGPNAEDLAGRMIEAGE